MQAQALNHLKEAAAGMAIEWFRKMAEERVLDEDAVKRIDVAFKVHQIVSTELALLNYKPEIDEWKEELIDIAEKIRDVIVEYAVFDDRLHDARTRLLDLAGIGGDE